MNAWKEFIDVQNKKPTTLAIFKKLSKMNNGTYYPAMDTIYRCFRETPLDEMTHVLLGQDPYYNGIADGLAFSTQDKKTPVSLKVLFSYLEKHRLIETPQKSNDLTPWAHQGILLLNSALTVQKDTAGSMLKDWEPFIMSTLRKAADHDKKIQFYTFGLHAQKLAHTALADCKQRVHCYMHPAYYARKNMPVPNDINANPFYAMSIHAKKQFNKELKWQL